MAQEVIDRIIENISSENKTCPEWDEKLCFSETDCLSAEFSKDNFENILPVTNPEQNINQSITFIDGGNAEIFASPDRGISFIRIFHTVYKENKRIRCSADEFYTLAKTSMVDFKLFFSVELFISKINLLTSSFFKEKLVFNPLDSAFTERNSRMTISRVPGIVRRIAELSTALLIASKANPLDIVVIDGDLCPKTTEEKKIIAALKQVAQERNIHVCGIAKTSDLLTSKGRSVPALLKKIAPDGCWVYRCAGKRDNSIISFAKLHAKSDYIFKIETLSTTLPATILPLIASNSTDAVFIGYPYGLIEADRFARISNREREMLRTTFMAKSGKDWQSFRSSETSLNAHSVLDNIS